MSHPEIAAAMIQTSYRDLLFLFIWYLVEFVYMLCVIAYVLYTFGAIKPIKPKEDVPATMDQTWSQTRAVLGNIASITGKVNKLIDQQPPTK